MGALTLGDHPRVRAKAIEHWDCAALAQGPWSVVIRASDGHPGVRGAVVTFPYTWDPQTPQTPLSKPRGATWNAEYRMLTWPLADSHTYIVGDLGQATLADLAARVTVENGRPHFLPLDGFTAVAATTSRAWVIHEMLYDTVDLGQVGALGNGQVWTGVLRGVRDQGGGFLIWESAPGELT